MKVIVVIEKNKRIRGTAQIKGQQMVQGQGIMYNIPEEDYEMLKKKGRCGSPFGWILTKDYFIMK